MGFIAPILMGAASSFANSAASSLGGKLFGGGGSPGMPYQAPGVPQGGGQGYSSFQERVMGPNRMYGNPQSFQGAQNLFGMPQMYRPPQQLQQPPLPPLPNQQGY